MLVVCIYYITMTIFTMNKVFFSSVILCVLSVFLYSCNKEIPYNENGDLVSMKQAQSIMKDTYSMNYHDSYMYNTIIPSNTPFITYNNHLKKNTDSISPDYDAWMFMVNPNPWNIDINLSLPWDCYYVNAFSGKVLHTKIDSIPTEDSGDLFSRNNLKMKGNEFTWK